MIMHIRPVEKSDISEIQRLNEAVVPHVNSIPDSDFIKFMQISSFFLVIEDDFGRVAGFIIVLGPSVKYNSPNYRYFCERYDHFDYVDRIVIAEEFRGKGCGTAFYKYLRENSAQEYITCEVNLEPPNPRSVAFHTQLGFKEVAQLQTDESKKRVSLMVVNRFKI